ncbi:zinc finger, CCHC-type containing protein [Tanacetum coccineum]
MISSSLIFLSVVSLSGVSSSVLPRNNKPGRGPSRTMMTMSAEDSLEAKYMAEDASCKKFLVSNFTNYKMNDSRPVMEQYNELLHTLETIKGGINLVDLAVILRIEESLRVQDSDKPKSNNVAGPLVVNMMEHNNSSRFNIVNNNIGSAFMSTYKLNDSILWHARLGYVHFKRMQDMSNDGLILAFDMDTEKLIMEYLVNISKRRAFWSLNEDILKITILKTNMPYPSRKIRRIRACTHQRPQRNKAQYAVSRRPIRRIGNMESL